MKFLAAEYRPIQKAISDSGLPSEDFSFVKKSGKLHVQYAKGETPFVFFRKTETILDENKQWEKKVTYTIYAKSKGIVCKDLSDFLDAFRNWLATLGSGK